MRDPRFAPTRAATQTQRHCAVCGREAVWTFSAGYQEYPFCAKHAEESDARLTQYHQRFGRKGTA